MHFARPNIVFIYGNIVGVFEFDSTVFCNTELYLGGFWQSFGHSITWIFYISSNLGTNGTEAPSSIEL